jgi:hypothetical protein
MYVLAWMIDVPLCYAGDGVEGDGGAEEEESDADISGTKLVSATT